MSHCLDNPLPLTSQDPAHPNGWAGSCQIGLIYEINFLFPFSKNPMNALQKLESPHPGRFDKPAFPVLVPGI